MVNPENVVNNPRNNTFSKENQPSPLAKSEGVIKWWETRKAGEELRERIIKELYKQAGFTDDGESKLDIAFAQKTLNALEDGNMKLVLDIVKELIPEKKKYTDITSGNEKLKQTIDLTKISDEKLDELIKNSE